MVTPNESSCSVTGTLMCIRCGDAKDREDDFYKDKGKPQQPCKACRKSYAHARWQAAKQNPNPRSTEPKRCRKCDEVKSADEFYSDVSALDGLNSYCKECAKLDGKRHHQVRLATLNYVPTMEPKKCTICGVIKPPEDFNRSRINSSGLVAQCKECEKEYRQNRNFPRQTDPKECAKCGPPLLPDSMFHGDSYFVDGREPRCIVCIHKKSHNPDGKYTGHDYLRIEQEQGGYCRFYLFDGEGCWNSDEADKRLHIDHDHETGEIRALLCHNHNRRVVSLFDKLSPDQLCEILKYTGKLSGVIETARTKANSGL